MTESKPRVSNLLSGALQAFPNQHTPDRERLSPFATGGGGTSAFGPKSFGSQNPATSPKSSSPISAMAAKIVRHGMKGAGSPGKSTTDVKNKENVKDPTLTILPLAKDMLDNGYTALDVVKLVESHYQEKLRIFAKDEGERMKTDSVVQVLNSKVEKLTARNAELEHDLERVVLRYQGEIGAFEGNGNKAVNPYLQQFAHLVEAHKAQQAEKKKKAAGVANNFMGVLSPLAGTASTQLSPLASTAGRRPSKELSSTQLPSPGRRPSNLNVTYNTLGGTLREERTAGGGPGGENSSPPSQLQATTRSIGQESDIVAEGTDGTDNSATPARDTDAVNLLHFENEVLERAVDALSKDLDNARKVLSASVEDRRRLATQLRLQNVQSMEYHDEVSRLTQWMYAARKSISDEEASRILAEEAYRDQIHALKEELKEVERQRKVDQEIHKGKIKKVEDALFAERESAANREAELMAVVGQLKGMQGGADSSSLSVLEQHLEPVRQALKDSNKKLLEAEKELATWRASGVSSSVNVPNNNNSSNKHNQTSGAPVKLPPVGRSLLLTRAPSPDVLPVSQFEIRLPLGSTPTGLQRSSSLVQDHESIDDGADLENNNGDSHVGQRTVSPVRDATPQFASESKSRAHQTSSGHNPNASPSPLVDRNTALYQFERDMRRRTKKQQDLKNIQWVEGMSKTISNTMARLLEKQKPSSHVKK